MWHARLQDDSGFGLAEVLVTIGVMGTLAGTAAVATSDFTDAAQASACATEARIVRTAVGVFRASTGAHPTDIDAMVPTHLSKRPELVAVTFNGDETPVYSWIGPCAETPELAAP